MKKFLATIICLLIFVLGLEAQTVLRLDSNTMVRTDFFTTNNATKFVNGLNSNAQTYFTTNLMPWYLPSWSIIDPATFVVPAAAFATNALYWNGITSTPAIAALTTNDGRNLTNLQWAAIPNVPGSLVALATNNGVSLTNLQWVNIYDVPGSVIAVSTNNGGNLTNLQWSSIPNVPGSLVALSTNNGGNLTNIQWASIYDVPGNVAAISTNNGGNLTNLQWSSLVSMPVQLVALATNDAANLTNVQWSALSGTPGSITVLSTNNGQNLTNLQVAGIVGLGTMALQNSNAIDVVGGTVSNLSYLSVYDMLVTNLYALNVTNENLFVTNTGILTTNIISQAGSITNLWADGIFFGDGGGLTNLTWGSITGVPLFGSMAYQDATNVAIAGGVISNTIIAPDGAGRTNAWFHGIYLDPSVWQFSAADDILADTNTVLGMDGNYIQFTNASPMTITNMDMSTNYPPGTLFWTYGTAADITYSNVSGGSFMLSTNSVTFGTNQIALWASTTNGAVLINAPGGGGGTSLNGNLMALSTNDAVNLTNLQWGSLVGMPINLLTLSTNDAANLTNIQWSAITGVPVGVVAISTNNGGNLTNLPWGSLAGIPGSIVALSTNDGGNLTNLPWNSLIGMPVQLVALSTNDAANLTNLPWSALTALPGSIVALSTNNGGNLTNLSRFTGYETTGMVTSASLTDSNKFLLASGAWSNAVFNAGSATNMTLYAVTNWQLGMAATNVAWWVNDNQQILRLGNSLDTAGLREFDFGAQNSVGQYAMAIGGNNTSTVYGVTIGYLCRATASVGTPAAIAIGYNARSLSSLAGGVTIGGNAGTDSGVAIGQDSTNTTAGISIGFDSTAVGVGYGVAIGYKCEADDAGVAIGAAPSGHSVANTAGVAIGAKATGSNYGIAIGVYTWAPNKNIAIGTEDGNSGAFATLDIANGGAVVTNGTRNMALGIDSYIYGGTNSTALGTSAKIYNATNAVQIGLGTNTVNLTMQFRNSKVSDSRNGGIAMGYLTNLSYLHSIAIGDGGLEFATNYGIAIGYNSIGYDYGTALGPFAYTGPGIGASANVAIGGNAIATNYSVSIGGNSVAYNNSFAAGPGAVATNSYNTVVGYNASARGIKCVSVGSTAVSTGNYSVAVGPDSFAEKNQSIAMGYQAHTLIAGGNGSGIAIGASAHCYSDAIAIGGSAIVTNGIMAIGSGVEANGVNAIAIGGKVLSDYGVAMGVSSVPLITNSTSCVVIGREAHASNANSSVVVGAVANVYGPQSVAVGASATAISNSVSVGYSAKAASNNCIAIGPSAIATNDGSVSIGGAGSIADNFSTAIGYTPRAYDVSVYIGYGTSSYKATNSSIAIGRTPYADQQGVAIGFSPDARAVANAIGYSASASNNSSAIGYQANAKDQSVSFGNTSKAYNRSVTLAQGDCISSNRSIIIGAGGIGSGGGVSESNSISIFTVISDSYKTISNAVTVANMPSSTGSVACVSLGNAPHQALGAQNFVLGLSDYQQGTPATMGISPSLGSMATSSVRSMIMGVNSYGELATNSIAMGYNAKVTNVTDAVQIGKGTNAASYTMNFMGAQIADTNGLNSPQLVVSNVFVKNNLYVTNELHCDNILGMSPINIKSDRVNFMSQNGTATNMILGTNDVSLGSGASATNFATALGKNATASNQSLSVGSGQGTAFADTWAVAIGNGTVIASNASIAIGGQNAQAYNDSLTIGNGGNSILASVSVGRFTSATNNSTAIGQSSWADNYGVAVGQSCQSYLLGIAIGSSAIATNQGWGRGIAIGDTTYAGGEGTIAIGRFSQANSNYSISMGCANSAGAGTKGNGTHGIAIGYEVSINSDTAFDSAIAMGYTASVSDYNGYDGGVAIGKSSWSANGSVAVGCKAYAATNSVAVGYNSSALLGNSVAIGNYATATNSGTALGWLATAVGTNSVGVGYRALSLTNNAIQLGLGTNIAPSTMQFLTNQIADGFGLASPRLVVSNAFIKDNLYVTNQVYAAGYNSMSPMILQSPDQITMIVGGVTNMIVSNGTTYIHGMITGMSPLTIAGDVNFVNDGVTNMTFTTNGITFPSAVDSMTITNLTAINLTNSTVIDLQVTNSVAVNGKQGITAYITNLAPGGTNILGIEGGIIYTNIFQPE